eukprot:4579777-Ditylum_brightwellii.AAC.1
MIDKSNFTTKAVKLSISFKYVNWDRLDHLEQKYLRDGDIYSVSKLACLLNGAEALDEVEAAAQDEGENEQGNGRNSMSTSLRRSFEISNSTQ